MKRIVSTVLTVSLLVPLAGCTAAPTAKKTEPGPVDVYLVRHGQTMFNEREIMQGWCDSPLTELGVNQAKGLGKGLEDVDFVGAYSSVSERAADTAHYALGDRDDDIDLELSEDLKEVNFGEYEAIPNEEAWSHIDMTNIDFSPVGGESMEETGERAVKELYAIAGEVSEAGGGSILVASHGMTIMTVLFALGTEEQQQEVMQAGDTNCSVSVLHYEDGEWTVNSVFDTSYRDEGMKELGLE